MAEVAEYRVKITMHGYGSNERAAEDFLEGFLHVHPEAGPVVSLNSKEDTISVMLGLSAFSEPQALDNALGIWAAGGKEAGLSLTQPVRTEVERVVVDEGTEAAAYVHA